MIYVFSCRGGSVWIFPALKNFSSEVFGSAIQIHGIYFAVVAVTRTCNRFEFHDVHAVLVSSLCWVRCYFFRLCWNVWFFFKSLYKQRKTSNFSRGGYWVFPTIFITFSTRPLWKSLIDRFGKEVFVSSLQAVSIETLLIMWPLYFE